jgi:hypothetical protein
MYNDRLIAGWIVPHRLNDIPGIMRFPENQEYPDAIFHKAVGAGAHTNDQENASHDDLVRVSASATVLDIHCADDIPLPGVKFHMTMPRLS